mmetsp:Transcript_24376/g.70130  ORF Transcript_24376/g.70130 Transcript_24376/m.70130 type:complete len:376 (-) Transcript_24376:139-1266(-)
MGVTIQTVHNIISSLLQNLHSSFKVSRGLLKFAVVSVSAPPLEKQSRSLRLSIDSAALEFAQIFREGSHAPRLCCLGHPCAVSGKALQKLEDGMLRGEGTILLGRILLNLGEEALDLTGQNLSHEILDLVLTDGRSQRNAHPDLVSVLLHELQLECAHFYQGIRRPSHGFEDAQPSIARLLMGRLSIQDGVAIDKSKGVVAALLVHGASVVDEGDELPSEASRQIPSTTTLSGLDQVNRFRKGLSRLGVLLPLEEGLAAAVDLLNLGVEGLGLRRSGIGRERSFLIGIATLLAGGCRQILGGHGIGSIGGRGLALGLLLLQVVAIAIGGKALIASAAAAAAAAAHDPPQQQRRQGRRRNAQRNGLGPGQFIRHLL